MKYSLLFLLALAFSFTVTAEAKMPVGKEKTAVKNGRKPASLDMSCQGALLDYYPCISSSISRKQAEVQGKEGHEAEAAALERLENAFNDLKSKKRLPEASAQVLNSFCQMMLNVDDFVGAQ